MAKRTKRDKLEQDISIENHGSIVLVRALTPEAKQWLADSVQEEATWWAGALVVEPRYLGNLVDGMIDSGLKVGQ